MEMLQNLSLELGALCLGRLQDGVSQVCYPSAVRNGGYDTEQGAINFQAKF
jgi:hypothetical protein